MQSSPGKSSQEPNARSILALAFPALGVLAATPLYLLWDTAVVGRLGADGLAALAAGATVLSVVTTQLTFLSYGTTARAARHFGAGRTTDAVYEGIQATWVALGVGLCLAGILWWCAPTVMSLFADQTEVVRLATSWIRVTTLSIVPALAVMAGNGWLRGMSNTRWPLWFTLVGVLPMAVTVPVLVNRYGVVGSAYANVLGEVITALCFCVALVVRWRQVGDGRSIWPCWRVIRSQLIMGRDLIARSLSFQVSFVSAAVVAGGFGSAALAAHQVLLQLWNFLSLVLDSVAIAAQALVGAALGAGQAARARAIGVSVLRFSMVASAVIAIALACGYSVIPQVFSADQAVLDAISGPWWLLVLLAILGGVAFALDGVLLGAADVAFLRNVTIGSALLGFVPMVWISRVAEWGLLGVWWGLVIFMLLRMLAVAWRFCGNRWVNVTIDNKN